MNKYLLLLLILLPVSVFGQSDKLQGIWISSDKTTEIIIVGDTLCIDELEDEGDEYVFKYDSIHHIICCESYLYPDDVFKIKITCLTRNILKFYYLDDEFREIQKFKKKKIYINTK